MHISPEIVILAKGGSLHHAQPFLENFGSRAIVESDWIPDAVMRHQPGLVITFDEHGADLGLCVSQAVKHDIACLLIRDGILEWRMIWEYETSLKKRPINQPILSHKVACLGRTDAHIMESWGNIGKCEVVGCPRFDQLVSLNRPMRTEPVYERPLKLLVMTAKTPGFTPEQVETTYRSLADLRDVLAERNDIEVAWRVTQNLHERLGVRNTVRNILSTELHDILEGVDAVITTPSTSMLESMLFGHPVALLDYHNRPHYFPAAWRIGCKSHIGPVLSDLINAPLPWMLYQAQCLHDGLACRTSAFPRMVHLIENMLEVRRENVSRNIPLSFPHRILDCPDEHIAWPHESFDLERLYPQHKVFGFRDVTILQAELETALGSVALLKEKVDILSNRLHRIPGYTLATTVARRLKRFR